MSDALTALDATFLELEEADESAHMHIGGVMVFEARDQGPPTVAEVSADVERRLRQLPRYSQRLSTTETGGLSWPEWERDPDFDLRHHVFAAALPAPAAEAELLDWSADYFSQRLDRHRPLWEITLLPLADGRWSLVSKTHHCMVDGVGSIDVAKALLDLEREPPVRPGPSSSPGPDPATAADDPAGQGLRSLLPTPVRALGGRALSGLAGLAHLGGEALGTVSSRRRLGEALRTSEAMLEVLLRDELIPAPASSLNVAIGTRRRLAVAEIPLSELKQIRAAHGGTVNDAVLAAATAGFRRLLQQRGEDPPERGLRAMVPVNVRAAGDRLGLGNEITSLFVHLPVAVADRADRYRSALEEAEGLKESSQGIGTGGIVRLAGHAPPVIHSLIARSLFATRLFNVTITNVPGPQRPLYAFGSKMLAAWPLVPLAAEHAVALAVLSYDGRMFFCLNADRDAVPDLAVLRDGIVDEIAALAAEAPVETATGSPA